MKREFTQREKVLMLILVVILLLTGYLKLFYEPLGTQLAEAQDRLAEAQDTVLLEQTKLTQMQSMQAELDDMKASGMVQSAEIPDYDNIENVMIQLDAILGAATDYDLTFSDLQFSDVLVLRPIQMNFTAGNYAQAKQILTNLYNCWYRCSLNNIVMTASEDSVAAQEVKVSLTVTFYEKYDAAAAADDPANAPSADGSAAASSSGT